MAAQEGGGGLMDLYIDSVVMGSITLPPPGTRGVASCSVVPKMKVDEKAAAGKNGSRVTLQGVDNADVEIACRVDAKLGRPADYRATRQLVVDAMRELVRAMANGPLQLSHVAAEAADVDSVQIKELPGGLTLEKGAWVLKVKGIGWSSAAQAGKGCQLLLLKGSTDKTTSGEVSKWQTFLAAQGYYSGAVDGAFSAAVDTATRAFQTATSAKVDGIVGPETFGKAAALGYTIPAPKACGSATKTPTKADPADPKDQVGPPTAADLAKMERAAAMDEWAKSGTPPNERGEGLPSDFTSDPWAYIFDKGGAP